MSYVICDLTVWDVLTFQQTRDNAVYVHDVGHVSLLLLLQILLLSLLLIPLPVSVVCFLICLPDFSSVISAQAYVFSVYVMYVISSM